MSLFKKIMGTIENEFSIGIGANRFRLINNSKVLEFKDKDNNPLTLGIDKVALPSTLTDKETPVDADLIPIGDSAASGVWKKLTWANLLAKAKTYFDTLYSTAKISMGILTSDFTTTSTDYVDVTGVTVAVEANTSYYIKWSVEIQSSAGDDVRVIIDAPSGTTLITNGYFFNNSSTPSFTRITSIAATSILAGAGGYLSVREMTGKVTTSSTAGNLKMQFKKVAHTDSANGIVKAVCQIMIIKLYMIK